MTLAKRWALLCQQELHQVLARAPDLDRRRWGLLGPGRRPLYLPSDARLLRSACGTAGHASSSLSSELLPFNISLLFTRFILAYGVNFLFTALRCFGTYVPFRNIT